MRVLIAPWGNPFQWESVNYRFNDTTIKKESTLPVLVDVLKPDKVLIIVLDTLANIQIRGEPDIRPKKFSNYDDVVQDVEERVKWFLINKIAEENILKMLKNGSLKVIVSPGVGTFKNIVVDGDISDFYSYAVYSLSKELPDCSMEVYLDLTHGINFMPTLIYRTLNELLSLASFINNYKFVVLNSEPLPQGFSNEERKLVISKTTLYIRTIEEKELNPIPIYSKVENKRISAFIASLVNGFPLSFATFYPDINDLELKLSREIIEFIKNIEVQDEKIKRRKRLSDDFKTLSKLYYLLRCLKSSNELFESLPRGEVEIDNLECFIELIFRKIPRLEVTTKRDVRQIFDIIKKAIKMDGSIGDKLRTGSKVLYLDIYNFVKGRNFQKRPNIDPRDFIAHSGLISDTIYVRHENGKILISYDETRVEEILNLIVKSI